MKGTFFQKPLELGLVIEGEAWRQGDPIQGTLTIKNRGSDTAPIESTRVLLTYGNLKKVHSKEPESLEIVASRSPEGKPPLSAPGETTLPWRFETDRNCPITDTTASLFIVYGQGDALETLGHLQLKVSPFQVAEDFLQVIQTQFRFVKKSQKSPKGAKGAVETKLEPPSSKGFAMLELLTVSTFFEGDDMRVSYSFQLKKMEATAAASIDITKLKKRFEQTFTPSDYKIASGRFNHERMEAAVKEVLSQVESKIVFD